MIDLLHPSIISPACSECHMKNMKTYFPQSVSGGGFNQYFGIIFSRKSLAGYQKMFITTSHISIRHICNKVQPSWHPGEGWSGCSLQNHSLFSLEFC